MWPDRRENHCVRQGRKGQCGSRVKFRGIRKNITAATAVHSLCLDSRLIDLRCCIPGFEADSVDSEKPLGKIKMTEHVDGNVADHSFGNRFDLSAQLDNAAADPRQCTGMSQSIGDKGHIGSRQIVGDQPGCRSGIQKDNIAVFNHSGSMGSNRPLFLQVEVMLGLHVVVVAEIAGERRCTTVYLEQPPLTVQGGQITADGRFRSAEMMGQLRDGYSLFFIQKAQNGLKSFFGEYKQSLLSRSFGFYY